MANITIPDLPAAIALTGAENIPAVQSGSTVRITTAQIAGLSTPGANNSLITATGSTAARTLANRFADAVNVKDFGTVGNGVADDTAAIQAALTAGAGGFVWFPAPTVGYLVSAPIYVSSKTTVLGAGAGCVILISGAVAPLPNSTNPALGSVVGPVVFVNLNWQATSLTDSNINISGFYIRPLAATGRVGCHGVFLRMVQNTQILQMVFERLNDGVAHLACNNTLVEACYAYDVGNCPFDHWDGPSNATVRDCQALGGISSPSSFGILFNVDSTVAGYSSGSGSNFTAENNRIYGYGVGIFVAPLNAPFTQYNAKLCNNYINQVGLAAQSGGIVYHGITNGIIDGNTIEGATTVPIYIGIETNPSYPSSRITICNNTLVSCVIGANTLIAAYGNFNSIYGNKAINCTAIGGYGIGVDDPNSTIMENDLLGWTLGYVLNQHPYGGGTTPALQLDADRVNGAWSVRQGMRFGTAASAATLDAYETGNWTPSVTFGGASVGVTYSQQVGTFIRVGKLVHITCDIALSAKGSSVGGAVVNGLPYSQGGSSTGQALATSYLANSIGMTAFPVGVASATSISLSLNPSSAVMTDANFTNGTYLRMNGFYRLS